MGFWNSKYIAISFAPILVTAMSPAFAAGGGGGGGGSGMPSQTTPSYDPALDYQKGTIAFRAGQYEDAVKAFKRVVRATPINKQAQYLLGASYMALSNYKKAKSPMLAAVRYDGKMIEARRDLAIIHAKLGEAQKAQEQVAALKTMAVSCAAGCRDKDSLSEAIVKAEAALAAGKTALGPVSPDIHLAEALSVDETYVAAVSLINEKRYDQAIAKLDDAVWAAGPHPDILTYLGFANRKLRKYDVAEGYYKAALAVAPNHRGALEYYGELKLERGDVSGAKAHLAKLEALCGFGCQEADELRRWIKDMRSSES